MRKIILILFALIALSIPILGLANEFGAQRGTPLSAFLDDQGHLRIPNGYAGSLDPTGYRMLAQAGQTPKFVMDAKQASLLSDSGQWTGFGGIQNGCNGTILAMAQMPDGNLVVAGSFRACTDVPANNIAIYTPETDTWASLGSGDTNGVDSLVNALAVSGNDLFVGGYFTQAGGLTANYVARWRDGAWASLGMGTSNGVSNVVAALAVSGKDLFVGGEFTEAGGVSANRVARWTGNVWANLGVGIGDSATYSEVNALAVSGTNLFVGGKFRLAGGMPANNIARWDGNAWSSLGAGIGDTLTFAEVKTIAVSGNDLYVGGGFTQAGGQPANRVARWNGTEWASLGAGIGDGGGGLVYALVVLGSDIYVSGYFGQAGNVPAHAVARWNGNTWTGLGNGDDVLGGIFALAASGSNLYVGAYITNADGPLTNGVARWRENTWTPLGGGRGNGANGPIFAVAISGSDLYVGGQFSQVGNVAANNIARWNGNNWTSLDTGVGSNPQIHAVRAIAVSGTDLYVGGYFNQAREVETYNVARWNGRSWFSLGSGSANGVNGSVLAMALSGDNLYVGGNFTHAGGEPANRVARWDGSVWVSLGAGVSDPIAQSEVNALATSGSDLYAGGYFTQAGDAPANNLARWNGNAWSSVGNGVNGIVNALAVSGNDLYVGGNFTQVDDLLIEYLARWNGNSWSSVGSVSSAPISAIAVSGNNLYVGGQFTELGGVAAKNVGHWNGSTWSSLGTGVGVLRNTVVRALGLNGTQIYVGGGFGSAGDQTSVNIAKWTASDTFFINGFEEN